MRTTIHINTTTTTVHSVFLTPQQTMSYLHIQLWEKHTSGGLCKSHIFVQRWQILTSKVTKEFSQTIKGSTEQFSGGSLNPALLGRDARFSPTQITLSGHRIRPNYVHLGETLCYNYGGKCVSNCCILSVIPQVTVNWIMHHELCVWYKTSWNQTKQMVI